jgi:hypothetical protein
MSKRRKNATRALLPSGCVLLRSSLARACGCVACVAGWVGSLLELAWPVSFYFIFFPFFIL